MELRPWKRVKVNDKSEWVRGHGWRRRPLAYRIDFGRERWLLTGPSLERPDELTCYRIYGPKETSLAKLQRTASIGQVIAEGTERAKSEVGLDQYEVRHWEAWHSHVTLCLLAHASLQIRRASARRP